MHIPGKNAARTVAGLLLVAAAGTSLGGCFEVDVAESEKSVYRIIVIGPGRGEDGQVLVDKKGRVMPAVGFGTGFLVHGDSLVATNHHVVKNAHKDDHGRPYIFVGYLKFANRAAADQNAVGVPEWIRASIFKSDEVKDIAILETYKRLPGKPLSLADLDQAISFEDGTDVKAIGFPGAADFTLDTTPQPSNDEFVSHILQQLVSKPELVVATKTDGRISRSFEAGNLRYIQHQANLSGGNSGGPLFDPCGTVIGINSFKSRASDSIGVALDARELVKYMTLMGIVPGARTQQCNAARYNRMMPFAVGGAAVLLSLMGITIALRRPSIRNAVTRMTRASKMEPTAWPPARPTDAPPQWRPPARPTDASPQWRGATSSQFGGSPTRQTPQTAMQGGSLLLVPTAGGLPLTVRMGRLFGNGVVLGRQHDCDIVIEGDTISKRHARLYMDSSGGLIVEDLGSGNGTWRGKERITKCQLRDGDIIRFGADSFRVDLTSDPNRNQFESVSAGHDDAMMAAREERHWMLSGSDGGRPIQFKLEPRVDPRSGQAIETTWSIGRKPDLVDCVLHDQSVSSQHARVRFVPGRGLEICDLQSSNGTKVDGKAIGSNWVPLEGSPSIALGRLRLTLS